jgi:uncharacterized protein (TIGR03437 family)
LARLKVVLFAAALAVSILEHAGRAQTAANISVFQGNGQMICDGCPMTGLPFLDPLIVKVTDANGNPVQNVQVTWTVLSTTGTFAGSLASTTTVTGSTSGSSAVDCNFYNSSAPQKIGETCNVFTEGSAANPQLGFIVTTIRASIPNGQSVTFTLTQSPNLVQGAGNLSYIFAQIAVDSPLQVGATVSGQVGTVSSTPIKVVVRTVGNTFISGVSVRLIPEAVNQGGAAITCQTPAGSNGDPGSDLTGGDGTVLCYPMLTAAGSTPMNFDILVGGVASLVNPSSVNSFNQGVGQPAGTFQFGPFRATATPNNPTFLQPFSPQNGNTSANAGATVPLVVQVLDSGRNPLAGVTVNWTVTPANGATVNPASGTSDSNGKVSTNVTLTASATGTVQVAATVGSLSQSFSITVTMPTPPLSSLTKVAGGDGQSAPEGMAFSMPLAVMATLAGGAAASGVPVSFAVTSGSGTISASGGSPTQSVVVPTGSNGQASVTATAGSTPGTLTVTASVSGFSQTLTFSLTVLPPPPPISPTSFLNGAGFFPTVGSQQTALSPCGVATVVVGSPLAPSAYPLVPNMYTTPLQQAGNVSISFQLAGTATAATNAPILNVTTATTGQQLITFQVPCEIQANNWSVSVSINGSTVTISNVTVRPGAPGIFETLGSDGMRRAIAVRQNGSIVSPANPARQGEFIRFYITGAGPVLPALASGSLPGWSPGMSIDSVPTDPNQVAVGLNNSGVGAVTVRAAPELIGVYEVTFMVPNDPTLVGNNNVLAVGVTALGNPTQYQQPGGSKLAIQ